MANAEARTKNAKGEDLQLLLDIDLSSQKVLEMRAKGALAAAHAEELKEIESAILGQSIESILKLKRSDFRFSEKAKAMATPGFWLLHRAIENYLGSEAVLAEAKDRLCLCFGVGVHDLRKEILKRPDYELKHLIAETFATSACGSCLPSIRKTMEDLRLSHGMIEGLTHSKGRFDKAGNWVKVKGMYPGPLLVFLDEARKTWMKREQIESQFSIEFTQIEGLHLTVKITETGKEIERDRAEKILQALSDYLKSDTGILFFLHLDFLDS